MKTSEGWKYLDETAMRIVLDNSPAVAKAIAQWFQDVVEAQLEKVAQPTIPVKSRGLVEEILDQANQHGFVLGNYTTLSDKVRFLLEFEKLRKAKTSSKRQKLR
jgi:hypothetical protein